MKRRIVCFGDSNTWGYNAAADERYPEEKRWTGLLQQLLGDPYQILEEGQSGRTIMSDDPWEGEKKGYRYIVPCMETMNPFDLLVVMLGTNDMKVKFSLTPDDIARGMSRFLEKVISFSEFYLTAHRPEILLVSPVEIGEGIEESVCGEMFGGKRGRDKSLKLAAYYEEMAKKYHCYYLNAAVLAEPSAVDHVHLDEKGHRQLAEGLAEKIREIYRK